MNQDLAKEYCYVTQDLHNNNNDLSSNLKEFIQNINKCASIFIYQKFDVETAFLCVAPRKYKIYGEDDQKKMVSNKPLIYAKERSNCISRNCCPGDCQPFRMNIYQKLHVKDEIQNEIKVDKNINCFILLERQFRCTFLCFFRPFMNVSIRIQDGQFKQIGKIKDPLKICPPKEFFQTGVDVHDQNDNLLYKIEASEFSCGTCFSSCCCSPCQEVKFHIKTPHDDKTVGYVEKKATDCVKNALTGMSNFKIIYPEGINFEVKVLILAATFFIQSQMFIESPPEQSEDVDDILDLLQ